MSSKISRYFEVALNLTREAENLIRQKINLSKVVDLKSSPIDLVTETDKEVETLLIAGLSSKFPDHKFIGEESTDSNVQTSLTDSPTWIIDPIDGTLNFVHGNYNTCISIALFINKEPEIGIICAPMLNQLFTAIRGQGSFLNGWPIKVSENKKLASSLLSIEFGTSRDAQKMETTKENIINLLPLVQGFRSSGSAALNMASVAMGATDAYFEEGLHAWDMAAGSLIVAEAGGVVLDPTGSPLDIMSRRVLCSSSLQLAHEVSENVKVIGLKRDDE